jgi:ubiquitin C-terminal hydrolase
MAEEPGTFPFPGVRNLGNTCYMSASLQMFCTLSDTVLAIKNVAQDRGGNLTTSVVGIAEQLTINPSEATTGSTVNPKAVKEAMDEKTETFRGNKQQDAHEFFGDLVENIHKELKVGDDKEVAPPGDDQRDARKGSPMDDFLLKVEVCLKCESCKYSRYVRVVQLVHRDHSSS